MNSKIENHYSAENLIQHLVAALNERGLGKGSLSSEQLASFDQFHSRGLESTIELAAACDIKPETKVLDIGSGLGGPSRYLAENFGCKVVGVDLSESYVEAATYLAERAGLSKKINYIKGNALHLPFNDQSFDLGWTQHVAMNISNRSDLYSEIWRVIKPGGRLAIFDVVELKNDIQFPVPWAKTSSESFLLTPETMREILLEAGFTVQSWEDKSAEGIKWFEDLDKRLAASTDKLPPLSLKLAIGEDAPNMVGNLKRNLIEGKIALIQTVLSRNEIH